MALGGKLGLVFIAWDDTCIDIHHPWNPALTWRRKHPLSMFCLCQKTDWGPKETEPLKKKYQRNYKRVPKQHKRGKNHWKKEKLSQERSKGSKLLIKGQVKFSTYHTNQQCFHDATLVWISYRNPLWEKLVWDRPHSSISPRLQSGLDFEWHVPCSFWRGDVRP